MRFRRSLLTVALAVVLVVPMAAVAQDDAKIEAGRALTAAFFDGKTAELWEKMAPAMQQQLQNAEALAGFRGQAMAQLGEEVEVVSEEVGQDQGMDVYKRQSKFSNTGDMLIETLWAVNAEGIIHGFYIRPAQ